MRLFVCQLQKYINRTFDTHPKSRKAKYLMSASPVGARTPPAWFLWWRAGAAGRAGRRDSNPYTGRPVPGSSGCTPGGRARKNKRPQAPQGVAASGTVARRPRLRCSVAWGPPRSGPCRGSWSAVRGLGSGAQPVFATAPGLVWGGALSEPPGGTGRGRAGSPCGSGGGSAGRAAADGCI